MWLLPANCEQGKNCEEKWIWDGLDSLELIIFDVGVFLDGFRENYFSTFLEPGGGPLRVSLGCHQNFDIFATEHPFK